MVAKTINSLGFDLVIQVPGTVDEYDKLAKKDGAALDSAIMNVVYRAVNNKFRAAFVSAVENNTSIKRQTEAVLKADGTPKLDKEGEPIVKFAEEDDTEKKYFDRVCAVLVSEKKFESIEAAQASFSALAQEIIGGTDKVDAEGKRVNPGIAFDPTEQEKGPGGPKTVAKAYIKLAEQALAKGKLGALVAQLSTKLGATWKIEETVDSVARAISEDQRRKREAESLTAEYAL